MPTVNPTIDRLLFDLWRDSIGAIEDHAITPESAQILIDETRQTLKVCGCSREYQLCFFRILTKALPMLTNCHPVCRSFIPLLEVEIMELEGFC